MYCSKRLREKHKSAHEAGARSCDCIFRSIDGVISVAEWRKKKIFYLCPKIWENGGFEP
jgi:hypothetical protein